MTIKIGEFDSTDRKYWGPPEPGFSPEHNKRVIEETIKKHDKQRERKMKDFTGALRERTDAAATYLKSNKVGMKVEKYFGKTYLAYLRGEDIRNKLMQEQTMMLKPSQVLDQKAETKKLQEVIASGKGYKIRGKKQKKRTKKV